MIFIRKLIIALNLCMVLVYSDSDQFLAFEEQKHQELAKFFRKYQCSSFVEAEALGSNKSDKYFIKTIDKNPQQFSRIINASRLSNFFRIHNLYDLAVPEKCLTKDLKAIVAIGVSHDQIQSNPVSLPTMQQLVKMIQVTGYVDWVGRNMLRSSDGKLQFIDTEDRSFGSGPDWKSLTDYSGEVTSKLKEFSLRLLRHYLDTPGNNIKVEPEARLWLENEWLAQLKQIEEVKLNDCDYLTKEDCISRALEDSVSRMPTRCFEILKQKNVRKEPQLVNNSRYDDLEIDFQQVKYHFFAWHEKCKTK